MEIQELLLGERGLDCSERPNAAEAPGGSAEGSGEGVTGEGVRSQNGRLAKLEAGFG